MLNSGKNAEEQISTIYFFFASQKNVWILTLAGINGFSVFGTFFLLAFQLRFIALGFTTQFGPPSYFIKLNRNMKTYLGAMGHRISNLYVFFFGTHQRMLDLYYKQYKEHFSSLSTNNNAIPLMYPRDDFDKESDFPNINYSNIKTY